MTEHTGSSSLFAIFALSIYSLFLIPYTIYHFCNGSEDATVQPYLQGKKKKGGVVQALKGSLTKGNLILLAMWVIWFLLLWYIQITSQDLKPFDPWEILELERSATDKEIKKAYRTMSLKYHPDKNSDPASQAIFVLVTKAHQALTDEVAKNNYLKYGHPDGPQAIDVSVALPEWLFTKDSKVAPLMLLGLVGVGILLPLCVVSWYMLSSNRYSGPNGIMQETLAFYYHSKFSVKESQSLVRIPETLVCAMEFIIMPTPAEQTLALEELRKQVLRYHPDLKEKSQFWKRKASVLKAHMLLLAHLEREGDNVPALLQQDLKFVLLKTPMLLEEMLKIATMPRPPHGFGWLTPAVAIMEMQQCLSQALSINSRKPGGSTKPADSVANLLQVPHFDGDVVKKLKRRKINTLKELLELDSTERVEALTAAGLSAEHADEAITYISTLPTVYARVECEVEGEDEIIEGDVAKCRVRLLVTRPSHNSTDFAPKGKSIRAFTPNFPGPKEENWHLILADAANNAVLVWKSVSLVEAEAVGFDRPDLAEEWERGGGQANGVGPDGKALALAGGKEPAERAKSKALATANRFIRGYQDGLPHRAGKDGAEPAVPGSAEGGQVVELNFMVPKAGKHELQLILMSDCYVGCDKTLPVKVRVVALTRAVAEGRDAKNMAKAQQWASDDDKSEDGRRGSDAGSAAGSEDEEEDDADEDEYDSEETGELESGDDDEDDEVSEEGEQESAIVAK